MNRKEQDEFKEKTYSDGLMDTIHEVLSPLDSLISHSTRDYGPDNEMNDFLHLLQIISQRVRDDMEKVCACISGQIGEIKIARVKHDEILKIDEKWHRAGDPVKASLESHG